MRVSVFATSSGVPSATTCPPCGPPPGPRSMTQSHARMTSRSCSTTTTLAPCVDERVQRAHDVGRVLRVKAGARLVDDEQRPLGVLGERARELEPLRLAARERRERLSEREVAEPDPHDGVERPAQDVVAIAGGVEERQRLVDAHREDVGDRSGRDG